MDNIFPGQRWDWLTSIFHPTKRVKCQRPWKINEGDTCWIEKRNQQKRGREPSNTAIQSSRARQRQWYDQTDAKFIMKYDTLMARPSLVGSDTIELEAQVFQQLTVQDRNHSYTNAGPGLWWYRPRLFFVPNFQFACQLNFPLHITINGGNNRTSFISKPSSPPSSIHVYDRNQVLTREKHVVTTVTSICMKWERTAPDWRPSSLENIKHAIYVIMCKGVQKQRDIFLFL